MTELAKTFDPAAIESRWAAYWEEKGLFRPDRPGAAPFTIVNPPPNVTGALHIGHALDNTLQDILVRHARLQGKDALWVVGTDHAGIATQMVVERQMNAAGQKRTDLTREEFVSKVWAWKEESGGEITQQLRRLGCSMDWKNERFTMDPGFSKAVLKVFVDLHKQGLIYRDKRLVNWDPGLGTAISDLEVETREIKGSFWHLRYPLEDGSGFIQVATTRPETMLADMAVAVNASDERYAALVGKNVRLPITGRLIPIITDDHADPELGSGAVKITPGHDFNDFEVGRRAGIEARDMLNMLDGKANVTQTSDGLIPEAFLGMERFAARKAVVQQLKDAGFLVPHVDKDGEEHDAEPRTIQTPYGDRSGVVIEPWLTDQWYVDAETLAKPAIDAVRSGATKIVPKSWEKTYFNWMENIQPWCVSRQLWWGHRIPAWFGPELRDGKLIIEISRQQTGRNNKDVQFSGTKVFVAETEEEAVSLAQQYYGPDEKVIIGNTAAVIPQQTEDGLPNYQAISIARDPDVLDTWFSSALWPFATMGWPEDEHTTPFVPSDVEGRGDTTSGVSTALDTNGAGEVPSVSGKSLLGGRYPNDVLISGFDILFFWDARMMMQGLHFMKDVPFKTLYLHGLVRAGDGAKMSKSKGNVVNPLGLIDQYGADALRFFMAAMESQGRDIKMDERRIEGYRNFATKLWNAARFCQSNGIGASTTLEPPAADLAVNRWVIAETVKTVQTLDLALADLRFDEAANTLYHFVWSRFCDWYLELIKPVIQGEGGVPATGDAADETRAVAGWVLDQILVMLHPFMPFITEELWTEMGARESELIVAKWPMADARALDPAAAQEIDWLIRVVSEIRAARTELNMSPATKLNLIVRDAAAETQDRIARNTSALNRLARLSTIEIVSSHDGGAAAQVVVDEATFVLPLDGVIDLDAERARLTKGIEAAAKERDALAGRLNNPSFVERAKPEAVEKARADHADKAAEAERLQAALSRLG
ncbi:valine--tRNA ligase [Sphingobium boeckii]|uniref:Valine--tRNA ligase n=1 Tax=Sphingobium boeckii TaxID=1082345 RepID=A0A7W9EFL9_9SPHN|nr:valine--tRNA ligase [Sphingobium boeckii]MBB5685836.1 valyl-tRNA synthetase [Sphingobium boeckii]